MKPVPERRFWRRHLPVLLNVPFAIADATTLTEAGYVGEDVEIFFLKLIQAADYDVGVHSTALSILTRSIRSQKEIGECIHHETYPERVFSRHYLRFWKERFASVPPQGGRKHPQQELIPIDTTNILFICGGAFDGLEKIVEARMDASAIGFNAEV